MIPPPRRLLIVLPLGMQRHGEILARGFEGTGSAVDVCCFGAALMGRRYRNIVVFRADTKSETERKMEDDFIAVVLRTKMENAGDVPIIISI